MKENLTQKTYGKQKWIFYNSIHALEQNITKKLDQIITIESRMSIKVFNLNDNKIKTKTIKTAHKLYPADFKSCTQ